MHSSSTRNFGDVTENLNQHLEPGDLQDLTEQSLNCHPRASLRRVFTPLPPLRLYCRASDNPRWPIIAPSIGIFLLILAALLLCGCGTARVSTRREVSAVPSVKPRTIYVADFELDPSSIKSKKGLLPALPPTPGPIGNILPPLPGQKKDPEKLAKELVDTMSTSLVKDFTKAGYNAQRLSSGEKFPSSGWLVRGVFTTVDQGNQFRRTMIGFGAGKTDLQVLVDINDLEKGTPKRFYEVSTTADSGKTPGAAPTIVLGPAGAVARFVIAGKDLTRNVKQTASRIAEEVAQRTKQNLYTAK